MVARRGRYRNDSASPSVANGKVKISSSSNGVKETTTVHSTEGTSERRFSARIKEKSSCPNAKRVCYDERVLRRKKQKKEPNVVKKKNPVVTEEKPVSQTVSVAASDSNGVNGGCDGVPLANGVEKSDHARVKDTLRLFNKHYLHFVQVGVVVILCRDLMLFLLHYSVNILQATLSASFFLINGDSSKDDSKSTAKRPDLKALTKMRVTKAILYPEKRFGSLPGVDVGHQFFSRAEMAVVGFHSHWLNGIDYMGQSYARVYDGYTFPLAVAIVLSGVYEDDLDNSDEVVYTGQGGNNLLGDKRQIGDQKMERGNLALKCEIIELLLLLYQNCLDQSVPVRVVRGHNSTSSYVGKVYTYDGLYKVVKYWAEKGISGFTVFKFRLKRLEGQPDLTTNQVQTRGRIPNSISEIRGLVCEDITAGQEDIPIPATNLVDDPPVAPTGEFCQLMKASGFTYSKSIKVRHGIKLPPNATGCNCRGACNDPRTCKCARLNGCEFPYVSRDGGRLIEAKAVVFECGPNCGCGPGCVNRTSQKGPRFRLEVFRTPRKGWAVRSWDYIPSGAPVCEYTGILMRTDDVENASGNNYIFDIDCLQTMRGLEGRERRLRDVSIPINQLEDQLSDNAPEFCIDAGSTGNIARFINHSCEPNLFVQCVLSMHHDVKLARVMLFAADNIPPLQELCYDYGYVLNSVLDPNGNVRRLACYCGAEGCRKRLY
ncbi:SET domain [Dillenia turbinata]|uniref:SET domain n=1 Tax=Dillenia turbinata TaxID=194707 RepID=A0AAN8V6S4_9MAGN